MTRQDPSRETAEPGKVARPLHPRFGLGRLMLVMLVLSVTAATGHYLVRGLDADRTNQVTFVLFTLAAPVILVIVVSLVRSLIVWMDRSR